MSQQLWSNPDRSGTTYVTIDGVRYQVEGTGHSYKKLARMVAAGEAKVAGGE